MLITYIANGVAALASGFALFVLCFHRAWKSEHQPNRGFWIGVATIGLAIAIDFPINPDDLLKSIWNTYVFTLIVLMVLFGVLWLFSWAEE